MQSSDNFKTFEEVFSWSKPTDVLRDRTILFKVPGWWLYTIGNRHEVLYLAHGCCESYGGDKWGVVGRCIKCGGIPPDDVVTVATLYSGKRMEYK
jgi:hypothetical protein